MRSDLKQAVRQQILDERLDVLTSAVASPTGFPFKVAQLEDTVADEAIYSGRVRRCTVGHLVEFYQSSNGTIGTRCPAEPVKAFVQKGGNPAATEGSVCVCNGLISTAGYAQVDKLGEEPDLVTLGDDVGFLHELPIDGAGRYFAADAVAYLLGSIEVKPAARIDRGSPVVAGQRSGV